MNKRHNIPQQKRRFYKPLFPVLFSLLFFIVFGTALYLVYLDSEAVRDQINNDFNEQQLILSRQVSNQADLFLNNLDIQMQSLKWFCTNPDKDVRREALKAFFEQNKGSGILDAGFISKNGKVIEYINSDTLLKANYIELLREMYKYSGSVMRAGKINVDTNPGKTRIITNLYVPVTNNGAITGYLFSRLDIVSLFTSIAGRVRSGKTGYSWVIDENGLALYHPEQSFIGRNIFEARQKKKPYVNFSQINNIMKERMMKGEEGKGIYESWWHRDLNGHIIKLIAYTSIKNKAFPVNRLWSIAVVAPTSEVADAIARVYKRHLGAEAAIVIGMFLFVVLMVVYQRRISSSLKEKVNVQEEYITSILKNSMDGIVITDKDNRVEIWNKGAENIFEYSSEEMKGQTFHKLIPRDMDADSELRNIEDLVMKNGYISNYVAQRITKSGKRITVNISRTMISNDRGEKIGDTIIIRDETGKLELEQRIYNTEKLASIGNLAAGVAHEINNPLAVVLGFTDLLLERFPESSSEYEDLKIIESNAINAKKIVENLLGFARITEGMEDDIDVKHCIETVVNIVKNTLFTKKIKLITSIPDGLTHVRGDVREYQQVLFNLINNSLAAMKSQGKGTLTISAGEVEGCVNVDISDTGDGISEKIKQKVFDPFFTTKKVGEGTGLGLSLCYGIISKYGGKIRFSSVSVEDEPENPEHGTTFTVAMPVFEMVDKNIMMVKQIN